MKETLKVSIIIPVYNSEKYLEQCIKSIIEQTYRNIEVILCDDGSSDSSPAICDEFGKMDNRIKVIHQKNSGTSAARNRCLEIATGNYITFVDNDDYWNRPNCLEDVMLKLAESNADVLFHSSYQYWSDTNKMTVPNVKCHRNDVYGVDRAKALKTIICSGAMDRCVWSKIFKTSLIKENKIVFPEGLRNEDTLFVGQILMYAKTYDFFEEGFYVYRKGHIEAQTSKKLAYSSWKDLADICLELIEEYETKIENKQLQGVLMSYIAYPYCVWMGQKFIIDKAGHKKEIAYYVRQLKSKKYILQYDYDPKVRIVSRVKKICGFTCASFILGCYMRKGH